MGFIIRNAFEHKLRTLLTLFGIVLAMLAFGMLQTVAHAWVAGADISSPKRLISRHAVSFVMSLPLAYRDKIRSVSGVKTLSYSTWFGGVYRDPSNFFPQFAVDVRPFLEMYPELALSEEQKLAFLRDRRACIIGTKLAEMYGFKIGDVIPLQGTIFPGRWEFVVRGIFKYRGADVSADLTNMYFHWDYLNEQVNKMNPGQANQVNLYLVEAETPESVPMVAREIDQLFRNSAAETFTESEKAFQLNFVSMSEQIIFIIRAVSFVVIFIIMAVMANTMAMTSRERLPQYATLKALGFGSRYLVGLISGETFLIVSVGALSGIVLTYPAAAAFGAMVSAVFPIFKVAPYTWVWQVGCACAVGLAASIFPCISATRVSVVKGLRSIG